MNTTLVYLGLLILAIVMAACVVGVIEVIGAVIKGDF